MAVVLITGCSSGFGLAAALAFSKRGDTVVATVRDPSKAFALERGASSNIEIAYLDVTNSHARSATIERVLERHGGIDVLVNNAGIFSFGPAEAMGEADLRTQFETNVFGAFGMMMEVLPTMRGKGGGRIVNVTSVAALGAPPFMTGYAASKHALDAISSGMDHELCGFGIRVTTVAPVSFDTSIARQAPVFMTLYGGTPERQFCTFQQRLHSRLDLSHVTEAIVEAATSPAPRRRYIVAPGDLAFDALVAEKDRLDDARRPRA